MTIHRFLIENSAIDRASGLVRIVDPGQVKQLTRVLRLKIEDRIDVVDEDGNFYELALEKLSNTEVVARVLTTREFSPTRPFNITVVLPLLKGGNFESTLTKLTEIGVDRIIPVVTERTVARLPVEDIDLSSTDRKVSSASPNADKMRRWMSIIKEATEQCERLKSPQMVNVTTLEKALNHLRRADNPVATFICAERSQAPHLVTIVYGRTFREASPVVSLSDICIVIGPEGGFTDQEMSQAISLGCTPCSLGDNILRSETAATVAASLVASLGEISGAGAKYSSGT